MKKTLVVLGALVGIAALGFIILSIYTVLFDNLGTA